MDEKMKIEEVVTKHGERYRLGHEGVYKIFWDEEGDIVVCLPPARKQVGDRDGWYSFKRNLIIPIHEVAGVFQISEDGTFDGC